MIGPPDFSLQPFSFQVFTQLVTPAEHTLQTLALQGRLRHTLEMDVTLICTQQVSRSERLTVDGELAVRVEDQLLYVILFGLFQRFAGCLVHTETQKINLVSATNTLCICVKTLSVPLGQITRSAM